MGVEKGLRRATEVDKARASAAVLAAAAHCRQTAFMLARKRDMLVVS